jgi:hypothetical protein
VLAKGIPDKSFSVKTNSIFDKVYSFYSSELVYNDEFKQQSNGVYFPVCKYTLDYDKLHEWLLDQDYDPELYNKVLDSVFNKDKLKVQEILEDVIETNKSNTPSVPESLSDCSWWSLPQSTVDQLLEKTGQTSWTLEVYKNKDGTWGFDLPDLLTKNEKFVNGTQDVLDSWYSQLYYESGKYTNGKPSPGEKLLVTVSSEYFQDSNTTLLYWEDDNTYGSKDSPSLLKPSWYFDTTQGSKLWLCQYLQFLFKEKPPTLWVKLEKM